MRLRTIVRLRWIAVAGQTATVLAVYWGLGFDLPLGICLAVIAVSAWLNIMLRLRYPSSRRLRAPYATAMLAYDLFQLSLLLYLTGGLQNPFSFLLLIPVTVSAATQPPRSTLLLGAIAIICATLLLRFYLPLPWVDGQLLDMPIFYQIGLWAGVISGILFLGFYTWRIAKEAHQMSDALTATEMVLAREQQLSALDGLAAAAAHELGTPLSTISVVAKELERAVPDDSPFLEDISLLVSQAKRCREILATLTDRSGESDTMFMQFSLTHMLEEVISPYRTPDVSIDVSAGPRAGVSEEGKRQPVLVRNSGILYGLGNLVENAVDFATERVVISVSWDDSEIVIKITDDGPGFSITILEHLGEPYLTTRPTGDRLDGDDENGGMGLGFFIANTFLERSGASVVCANREGPETGAVVIVSWARNAIDTGVLEG